MTIELDFSVLVDAISIHIVACSRPMFSDITNNEIRKDFILIWLVKLRLAV